MQQDKAIVAPQGIATAHNLIIENRTKLTATGILRVISYDENTATAETGQGILVIGGKNLKVSELSCQSGELKVQGEIEYVQYEAS
ncbi:MAG: YabP/YqfC family sporulation protein, partial [Pygmaiobacter sp.]